jgi:hypothetical protein
MPHETDRPVVAPGPVKFGSVNGSFSEKADSKVGLLGQFGPLGHSGLEIPNQPSSIVGLASDTVMCLIF